MNYRESREYIKEINKYGSVLGLAGITALLNRLGNPQDDLKIVHFAGTNGKGSTITYTKSILMEAGYKVGTYTSPAVFDYMEIFQINDKSICEEEYAEHMTSIKRAADAMTDAGMAHPTPFEVETALAFLYFRKNNCDIVLLETGMGGETDATNVMKQVLCSVIVSISLDHTQFLGDTLSEIATVKAGIIKDGCPVVLSRQSAEVMDAVNQVAVRKEAELFITEIPYHIHTDYEGNTIFSYKHGKQLFENVRTKMLGAYQPYNAVTAMETAWILQKQGFDLNNYIRKGIEKAKIPGRFEMISENPPIIIDGAHNPDAVLKLMESLQIYFTNKRIAIIMGVLADKNYEEMVKRIVPLGVSVVTVTPPNPRALDAEILEKTVMKYNRNVSAAESLREAILISENKVRNGEADMILACGSLSYLGEIKKLVR